MSDDSISMPEARAIFDDGELITLLSIAENSSKDFAIDVHDGIDINARGKGGITPLIWAVGRRSTSAIAFLISSGADVSAVAAEGDGKTAVHWASAMDNSRSILEALLSAGADVDVLDGRGFETPLQTSIMYGRQESFQVLLGSGANPNHRDRLGNTPLHVAAGVGDSIMVLTLLEAGADPTLTNKQGVTFQRLFFMTPDRALTKSAREGRKAVTDWLIACGYVLEKE